MKKTNQELEEIVIMAKEGKDEGYCELVGEMKPYVAYTARKLLRKDPSKIKDLMQEGYIGLMDAVNKYEPGRVKFKSYAEIRIKGSMIDFMRKERGRGLTGAQRPLKKGAGDNQKRLEFMYMGDSTNEEGDLSYESLMGIGENITWKVNLVEEKEIIKSVLKGHQKKRVRILMGCMENEKHVDIGEKENLTESRVCQIKKEMIQKLGEDERIKSLKDY